MLTIPLELKFLKTLLSNPKTELFFISKILFNLSSIDLISSLQLQLQLQLQ